MIDTVQIVILSRDRPVFLKEAINSALLQNKAMVKIKIIVSDNSEKNDVFDLMKECYLKKRVEYVRRSPPVSAKEHFQVVISELNTKYAVLFHDDDILHPDYIKKIIPFLLSDNISAVGCNAFLFNNDVSDSVKEMHKYKVVQRFATEKEFLERYLIGSGGIAPYPGYIYNTKLLKRVSFDLLTGGKHSDVVLLSSLLNHGLILWIPESLMFYRIHNSNDSAIENIANRLSLLRYMFSKGVDKASYPVLLYKYVFWLKWMHQQQGLFPINILKWRYRIVAKYIFYKTIKILFSLFFWKAIMRRYGK